MATGMVRGFGPRALAGLGATQQQKTQAQIQGQDREQNQDRAQAAARAPEQATGRVVDACDSACKTQDGQAQASRPQADTPDRSAA